MPPNVRVGSASEQVTTRHVHTRGAACSEVGVQDDEVRFLTETSLPRVAIHIEFAALRARATPIDLTRAFGDQGLRGGSDGESGVAMNDLNLHRTTRS
jgi:hypothetical protein